MTDSEQLCRVVMSYSWYSDSDRLRAVVQTGESVWWIKRQKKVQTKIFFSIPRLPLVDAKSFETIGTRIELA